MKTCSVFLLLCLLAQVSLAQTKSPASKTNKPVKSRAKTVPDLMGLIVVDPGSVRGSAPITAIIDVIETNKVATSGVITVSVQKNVSFVDFKFDPTATSIGNNAVQNANWSVDSTSNPHFYIFKTTKVIAGGAMSTFGLTGTFITHVTGQLGISMNIAKGSGGETNGLNNMSSSAISYTP